MRRHILSLGILVFAALFLVLPATSHAAPELKEDMSQGDFALWVVEAVGALSKLPPAATSDDAIKFLTSLGIVPEDGWQKDQPISRKFLAELMGKSEEEISDLSFEDLIDQVRDFVQAIFDETLLGIFSPGASGTTSVPA